MSIFKSFALGLQILLFLGLCGCQPRLSVSSKGSDLVYRDYLDGREMIFADASATLQMFDEQISNMKQRIATHNMLNGPASCLAIGDPTHGLSNESIVFAKSSNASEGATFECGEREFTMTNCISTLSECQSYLVTVKLKNGKDSIYKYIFDKCRGVVSYFPDNSFEHAFVLSGEFGILGDANKCVHEGLR